LPEHLEAPAKAFDDLLPPLERARAALTGSVPGTRLPGRPLAETLSEFEDVRTEGVQPERFEGLIGLIGDLLAPLDAFERASTRFRELRG
jgi:hypothetical protein